MISRIPTALLLSATVTLLCSSALADNTSHIKSALQSVYASRDTAFVGKSVSGTLALYAADVVIISADGSQIKGLTGPRRDLSQLFAGDTTFSSAATEIEEFVADKTGKEVNTKSVRHIAVVSKTNAGQSAPSVIEEVVRDHWVIGKNGWHITRERRLTESTLIELCAAAGDGPVKNSIIGKWVGYLPSRPGTTAIMTLELHTDGTEVQTITAPNQNIIIQATYTAKDNIFTETLVSGTKNGVARPSDGKVQTFNYRLNGDTLLLSLSGAADAIRFTRQPN